MTTNSSKTLTRKSASSNSKKEKEIKLTNLQLFENKYKYEVLKLICNRNRTGIDINCKTANDLLHKSQTTLITIINEFKAIFNEMNKQDVEILNRVLGNRFDGQIELLELTEAHECKWNCNHNDNEFLFRDCINGITMANNYNEITFTVNGRKCNQAYAFYTISSNVEFINIATNKYLAMYMKYTGNDTDSLGYSSELEREHNKPKGSSTSVWPNVICINTIYDGLLYNASHYCNSVECFDEIAERFAAPHTRSISDVADYYRRTVHLCEIRDTEYNQLLFKSIAECNGKPCREIQSFNWELIDTMTNNLIIKSRNQIEKAQSVSSAGNSKRKSKVNIDYTSLFAELGIE